MRKAPSRHLGCRRQEDCRHGRRRKSRRRQAGRQKEVAAVDPVAKASQGVLATAEVGLKTARPINRRPQRPPRRLPTRKLPTRNGDQARQRQDSRRQRRFADRQTRPRDAGRRGGRRRTRILERGFTGRQPAGIAAATRFGIAAGKGNSWARTRTSGGDVDIDGSVDAYRKAKCRMAAKRGRKCPPRSAEFLGNGVTVALRTLTPSV